MNIPMSVAERLLYSTVKITAFSTTDSANEGTAFFALLKEDEEQGIIVPVLVTNKHVLKEAHRIEAEFHLVDNESKTLKPSGRFSSITLDINNNLLNHPNPDIDLCAIPIAKTIKYAHKAGAPIFYAPISLSDIPVDDDWQYLDAIEKITMVGCPDGLSDTVNKFPIVRQGITATSPKVDYEGKPEFMIDMACFPGSSGSPVFLFNDNGYFDRKTNTFIMGSSRLKLLGILYKGPSMISSGEVVLSQSRNFEISSMIHLGNVIKSTELRALALHHFPA